MDSQYPWTIKVHHFMCLKLKKFIDDTSNIFTNLESARPRCKSGIEALCSLRSSIERAKLLILHCSESSKLYLAVMGNKIKLRFERLRDSLISSLSQMQHLYPCPLAGQIERIVQDLRVSTFIVESSEDEAGKVLISLMKRDVVASSSFNILEFQAFQMAATRLQLSSPVEVLIEKRSIRKLLEKIKDSDLQKRKILKYLLYLIRKYGKLIGGVQRIKEGRDLGNPVVLDQVLSVNEPHPEFKCSISGKLMYDPVQTTNGQTFERIWIEKWLADGNETCPKTHVKLDDLSLVPDLVIKDAISGWCAKQGITISKPCIEPKLQELSSKGSSGSYFSSLEGLGLDVSNVSIHSSDADSGCDLLDTITDDGRSNVELSHRNKIIDHVFDLGFLSILGTFPWVLQCREVEDLNVKIKNGYRNISGISPIHVMSLVRFLDDAHDLPDFKAEKDGICLLLALLKAAGNEMVQLPVDAIYVLSSLLATEITEEALAVMEIVSSQKYSELAIVASGVLLVLLRALEDDRPECNLLALKTICHLSENNDISHHMVYLDYIARVSLFLDNDSDYYYSIKILRNLCNIEEAIAMIAESEDCFAAIAQILDAGAKEQQELAMHLLHSLCYDSTDRCQKILRDGIILSLADVYLNGDHTLKLAAKDLLQLSWNYNNGG